MRVARASQPEVCSRLSCTCCAQAASGRALPKARFGSASAVHKRFLEWEKAGFFESLWKAGLAEYDQMEGIAWRWRSIDGATFKAPMAQESVGPNPTDRGKNGSKRHLLVDGRGVPLSIIVTGANVHDSKRLEQLLSEIVVKRPLPTQRRSKHLCADAGYRGAALLRTIERHGYIPHVVDRRQEAKAKRRNPAKKAWRWVVEACHSCSIASASCWCGMKSLTEASWR